MSGDGRTVLRILAACAALATLLRILWAGSVELAPDEAWYWQWGLDPALGYRDHPPLLMRGSPQGKMPPTRMTSEIPS